MVCLFNMPVEKRGSEGMDNLTGDKLARATRYWFLKTKALMTPGFRPLFRKICIENIMVDAVVRAYTQFFSTYPPRRQLLAIRDPTRFIGSKMFLGVDNVLLLDRPRAALLRVAKNFMVLYNFLSYLTVLLRHLSAKEVVEARDLLEISATPLSKLPEEYISRMVNTETMFRFTRQHIIVTIPGAKRASDTGPFVLSVRHFAQCGDGHLLDHCQTLPSGTVLRITRGHVRILQLHAGSPGYVAVFVPIAQHHKVCVVGSVRVYTRTTQTPTWISQSKLLDSVSLDMVDVMLHKTSEKIHGWVDVGTVQAMQPPDQYTDTTTSLSTTYIDTDPGAESHVTGEVMVTLGDFDIPIDIGDHIEVLTAIMSPLV